MDILSPDAPDDAEEIDYFKKIRQYLLDEAFFLITSNSKKTHEGTPAKEIFNSLFMLGGVATFRYKKVIVELENRISSI